MGKEMPLERPLALCAQRAFTSAQQEPRAATTEVMLHFQLEGPSSSLLNVEIRFAQCHQMHHLNEGEELSSLTAALPHISPAQTKLMPPAHLFMTILLHSLGCCQNNSEMILSRAMPHGLTDLVSSHLSGPKSSEGKLVWVLKLSLKLQQLRLSCGARCVCTDVLSQKVLRINKKKVLEQPNLPSQSRQDATDGKYRQQISTPSLGGHHPVQKGELEHFFWLLRDPLCQWC